jgi:hypothetical protein
VQRKCNSCNETTQEPSTTLFMLSQFTRSQCSAYRNGRCAPYGKDSGYPCNWQPGKWASCNVFIENMKFYRYWDL